MPKRFGPALRKARKGANKTIRELAAVLGYSNTYVSDVELGNRPPLSTEKILLAAEGCAVGPEVLIAPAARDRGFLDIPTEDMSDEVLSSLVAVRAALGKSSKTSLRDLRGLFTRRGQ